MLQHLYIQNYALIEELDIDFENGFSVITGETGAGKSILLGALGLLLGQRADSKSIKEGENRCIIEATFDISSYHMQSFFEENDWDYDEECIIRREISSNGKSRAFVNDTPSNVSQLKDLGDLLIDIHSQHQNLLLSKENFQLQVLDILAKDKNELAQYHNIYKVYRELEKELQQAREEAGKNKDKLDYLTFQVQQLQEANPCVEEENDLQQELQILEHAEEIKSNLFQTSSLLEGEEMGIVNMIREVSKQFKSISRVYSPAIELAERAESCFLEMKDIAEEVSNNIDKIDFDPERLEWVNERLNTIYSLEQKHHVDNCAELLEIKSDLERQLEDVVNSDEKITELEKRLKASRQELTEAADILNKMRYAAAKTAEKEMMKSLAPLGMPNVQFKITITETKDFEYSGHDKVTFLFNANKNGSLQPISNIASGGEIARVMLCLKAMISDAVKLPTIIFDEIDTGVSGQIAEKMALIMKQMCSKQKMQVVSITHLPQIAAWGDNHYRVYKEEGDKFTTSHMTRLNTEERITEIAHMLSGTELTDAAIDNARSLLHI